MRYVLEDLNIKLDGLSEHGDVNGVPHDDLGDGVPYQSATAPFTVVCHEAGCQHARDVAD